MGPAFGSGGSFLGTAASTAAGVIGGGLLLNSNQFKGPLVLVSPYGKQLFAGTICSARRHAQQKSCGRVF
jgi:hypothetical protein